MPTPYHPAVYNLDLCILAYQLHAQSLKWPFDPYYERVAHIFNSIIPAKKQVTAEGKTIRKELMDNIRRDQGEAFSDDRLDPILACSRYEHLDPNHSTLVIPQKEKFILYKAPDSITKDIRHITVVGYDNNDEPLIKTEKSITNTNRGARDALYCFEGKTGCKVEGSRYARPGQKSLLGFVLKRHEEGGERFDLHIAFRGSRSGSADPTTMRVYKSGNGNPDWVTDLKTRTDWAVQPDLLTDDAITKLRLQSGFASCIFSARKNIKRCLELATKNDRQNLGQIHITGHSLGGALAACFKTAMTYGRGDDRPNLGPYDWWNANLITYASPPLCNDMLSKRTAFRQVSQASVNIRYFFKEDLVVQGYSAYGGKPALAYQVVDAAIFAGQGKKTNWHIGTEFPMDYSMLVDTEQFPSNFKDKLGAGELPHEPKWIRKGIIWHIQRFCPETVYQVIPFNDTTNDLYPDDPDSPWREYDKISEVPQGERTFITENMKEAVVKYCQYIASTVQPHFTTRKEEKRKALEDFCEGIKGSETKRDISTCVASLSRTVHDVNSNFGKIVQLLRTTTETYLGLNMH